MVLKHTAHTCQERQPRIPYSRRVWCKKRTTSAAIANRLIDDISQLVPREVIADVHILVVTDD
jgi:hypothetical protein